MNKQEIEHKLEQARIDRDLAVIQANKEIDRLKEQLAEAEKPKLRHGDFGMTTRDDCGKYKYNKFIVIKTPKGELEPQYQDGLTDGCNYAKKNLEEYTIFGNIFDLMKD